MPTIAELVHVKAEQQRVCGVRRPHLPTYRCEDKFPDHPDDHWCLERDGEGERRVVQVVRWPREGVAS